MEVVYNENCEKALLSISPLMEGLTRSSDATFLYDIFSGGIIWNDEFPNFGDLRKIQSWDIIRFLFHYRMSLILGNPRMRKD